MLHNIVEDKKIPAPTEDFEVASNNAQLNIQQPSLRTMAISERDDSKIQGEELRELIKSCVTDKLPLRKQVEINRK